MSWSSPGKVKRLVLGLYHLIGKFSEYWKQRGPLGTDTMHGLWGEFPTSCLWASLGERGEWVYHHHLPLPSVFLADSSSVLGLVF